MQLPRLRFSRRQMIVALAIASMLLAVFVAYPAWNQRRMERKQRHMLGIVQVWGRLAPVPESAEGLKVATEGGMFTRAFRVSFSDSMPEIDRWLNESPGTHEAKPERPTPGTRRYLIRPGGGAQHAEVTIDDASGLVSIYVYWS